MKSYNEQGFLITDSPSLTPRTTPTAVAEGAVSSPVDAAESAVSSPVVAAGASASQKITKVVSASAKGVGWKAADLGILSAFWLLGILLTF